MPNRGDRGGAKTRAHIAAVATDLFLARGFDDVTIAEVAKTAGVSKVTVFAHFDRKEDLLLDRAPDAVDLARRAIQERPAGVGPVTAFHHAVLDLADRQDPLAGMNEGVAAFMRVIRDSPALIARLRAFAYEVEDALTAELRADATFTGDPALTAALLVTAYRTVAVETVRQQLAGIPLPDVAADHRRRLESTFATLTGGLPE